MARSRAMSKMEYAALRGPGRFICETEKFVKRDGFKEVQVVGRVE